MYPKVWVNDGKLESIADKRHTALVYREKIYLLADLIHMKIFKEERIKDLDFIKKYGKHIRDMFAKYARLFASTPMCDFLALQGFYLEANGGKWSVMLCSELSDTCYHMDRFRAFLSMTSHVHSLNEYHAVLSDTCYHMDRFRAFLSTTSHVHSLNEFIHITTTTARFLENYITRSKTFNV